MIQKFSQKNFQPATAVLHPQEMSADSATLNPAIRQSLSGRDQTRTSQNRAAIFIDGASLYYAAQQLGIEIDYSKLLYELAKDHRLLRAFFYTGVDRTNEKQQGFLLWMRHNGYRVITKELTHYPDHPKRLSLDVEITVDMIKLANYCETIILVSGDGNLSYAVNSISYEGVQVQVVSPRSMVSESLINVCDRYIDLETLKPLIQKTPEEKGNEVASPFPSKLLQ